MSTWVKESRPNWVHRFCARVLRCGATPRHVGIIMDGNRRFAQKHQMERREGHMEGFNKLAEMLGWCLELDINEVTVYAFSIENFKRSKEEVNTLMEIARQKFAKLLEEREYLEKHQVQVRVYGDISLLPDDLQKIVAEIMLVTESNTRAFLNVCLAYTSRDEICMAMRDITTGVEEGLLMSEDICEEVIDKCLYSSRSQPLDLLIRTSGEVRLSDFMLWQSSSSILSFLPALWPEFSRWNLYQAVLYYQIQLKEVQKLSIPETKVPMDAEQRSRINAFLEWNERRKTEEFRNMLHG